jgi:hypothetical protein
MSSQDKKNAWEETQISLKDIVLSNSWALQSILLYLEEQKPGARDTIWQHYLALKKEAEAAMQNHGEEPHDEPLDTQEKI